VAVLSPSREKDIVIARKVYAYLLWDILKLTHEKIAKLVNRKVSAVTQSLNKTKAEIDVYKKFENEAVQIAQKYAEYYQALQFQQTGVSGRSEQLCGNLDENYNCKNMCLTRCVDGNKFYK